MSGVRLWSVMGAWGVQHIVGCAYELDGASSVEQDIAQNVDGKVAIGRNDARRRCQSWRSEQRMHQFGVVKSLRMGIKGIGG